MPSPIGHALAGVAAAWAVDLVPGDRAWRTAPASAAWYLRAGDGLTLLCAGLGAAPDLDLAFVAHRTVTHSIGAVVRRRRCSPPRSRPTSRRPIARVALMCARRVRLAPAARLARRRLAIRRAACSCCGRSATSGTSRALDLFRQTARLRIFTRGPMLTNVRAVAAGDWRFSVPAVVGALASTCKSPGRTCDRDVRPRPSAAVADTGGTSDRRGRRAAR